jgi:hypothetical protein
LTSIFLQKPNLQQQLECVLKLGHGGDTSTKFEIEVYMEFLNDLSLDKHARVVGNEYEDILEEGNRIKKGIGLAWKCLIS